MRLSWPDRLAPTPPPRAGPRQTDTARPSLDSCADDAAADTPLLPQYHPAGAGGLKEWNANAARASALPRAGGRHVRGFSDLVGGDAAQGLPTQRDCAGGSPRSYTHTLRSHRRQHRLEKLAYSSAALCFAGSCLFAAAVLGWTAHFFYVRHAAYATAVFSPPMVPDPVEVESRAPAFPFTLSPNSTSSPAHEGSRSADEAARVELIERELNARFTALGIPETRSLSCASLERDTALASRYAPLRRAGPDETRTGRTFFALNLYNSELVVPALSHALLHAISLLGPSSVHVSVFENGSTDNTTTALAHLAAALTALGAEHTIVSDPRQTNWKAVDRIDQLAVYRNVALAPLEGFNVTEFSDVLFVNDVFACPGDMLELLFQRRAQEADAACALDWRANKGPGHWWNDNVKFYDNWVARSLTGSMLRARTDILSEWRDGVDELFDQPDSCWNGMLALDAAPFTTISVAPRYDPHSPVSSTARKSWRRLPPVRALEPARFRSTLNRAGECAASECKTLAKDFWSRGFDRWLVVPSVHVTYAAEVYAHPRLKQLASLSPPSESALTLPAAFPSTLSPASSEPTELIAWASLSPPDSVVCWSWVRGFHLDFEWIRAQWYRPYSYARQILRR
ncbi:hypothetical protein Rhopal_004072-T1 [Rhodotorula paludigena]|uniref:Glycosyltransferase family 69 protein n=1 Tax=Rhodotorula paludigena TaxID=86838 RepID=A0AAV5GPX1_9BASI|nr:hypothetical protein Rhopal_004072-T1 [Rhodotorula paludigena]